MLEFTELGNYDIRYDAFMEPSGGSFFDRLGIQAEDVTVDLHGNKPDALVLSKSYVITCREINSTPIRTFPVRFRPVEMNLEYESAPGGYIHLRLYKLEPDSVLKPLSTRDYFELTRYYSYYDIGNKNHMMGYLQQYFRNVRFKLRKKLF
jgi:hypothetical protein